MTILDERVEAAASEPPPEPAQSRERLGVVGWLTSTDHKVIGLSYMTTAFVFFLLAGLMALVIRAQLAAPEQTLVVESTYNELFTIHGTIMLFMFATPFVFGLANYMVPLMVGAPDMAFPRLNALGYWLYLFGGLTLLGGFTTDGGPAAFGWTAYAPLSDAVRSPELGADLWMLAIGLTGISTVLGAVNVLATVLLLRTPGMTMFRMPIYVWNMIVTSILVLLAFPVLTAAIAMMLADRHLGAFVFDAAAGGSPILWQHMFWFFGHPEVYILALPFFGVVTEIFPTFSGRPVFGYRGLVFATLVIAALSLGVWAHHMYTTGDVVLPFFTLMTFLISVPTGVKFFNWIGTMWGGQLRFPAPMLWACGFLFVFLIGGVTGIMLAASPIDFHVHDTYFVVAHFHYVLFAATVFGGFAAVYYWFPKWTGRRLHEGWSWTHFVLTVIGFNLTFFPQHVLGLMGMPRRYATYLEVDGFGSLNLLSSIGAGILGIAFVPFIWNVIRTLRKGPRVGNDPWGGYTLEWHTTSPPPPWNFDSLPDVRSERPLWDLRQSRQKALAEARGDSPGAGG